MNRWNRLYTRSGRHVNITYAVQKVLHDKDDVLTVRDIVYYLRARGYHYVYNGNKSTVNLSVAVSSILIMLHKQRKVRKTKSKNIKPNHLNRYKLLKSGRID